MCFVVIFYVKTPGNDARRQKGRRKAKSVCRTSAETGRHSVDSEFGGDRAASRQWVSRLFCDRTIDSGMACLRDC